MTSRDLKEKQMLSDASFRRTVRCGHFESLLNDKSKIMATFSKFHITEVDSKLIDKSELLRNSEFNLPFVIKGTSELLDITVPKYGTTLTEIADKIGPTFPIKIIEVGEQNEIVGWNIGEYAYYLKNRTSAHKLVNMISLEFSSTALQSEVRSPGFVRQIDWIDHVWPMERRLTKNDYPQVQKYCLSGMKHSYTDFHIDFGGTSVWYHVVSGQKRFFLVPPSVENLNKFKQWSVSPTQGEDFFGYLVGKKECFYYDLYPGDTFMIPSGWIHSVYTPEDSLVFGGNFLHSNAILRQLQVYQIESKTHVGKKYRFPLFRQINWYLLCSALPVAYAKYVSLEDIDDDDDDLDGEVENTVNNLLKPSLFFQIVLLVKMCGRWVDKMKALQDKENSALNGDNSVAVKTENDESYDRRMFREAAISLAHKNTPQEVVDTWWTILRVTALQIDENNKKNGENATTTSAVAYVEMVLSTPDSIDLLDSAVVGPALTTYDKEMAVLYNTMNIHASNSAAAGGGAEVSCELNGGSSYNNSEVLSFKIPRSIKRTCMNHDAVADAAKMETTNTSDSSLPDEQPSEYEHHHRKNCVAAKDTESSVADDSNTLFASTAQSSCDAEDDDWVADEQQQQQPVSLKLKLNRNVINRELLNSSSVPSPTKNIDFSSQSNSGGLSPQALARVAQRDKAKEMLTNPITSTKPTFDSSRLRLTLSSRPAVVKPVPANIVSIAAVSGRETAGQRRFGTRGVKLSSDFLKNAVDMDILTEEQPLSDDDGSVKAKGEDEEEFLFEDAECRAAGGEEYDDAVGGDVRAYDEALDSDSHDEPLSDGEDYDFDEIGHKSRHKRTKRAVNDYSDDDSDNFDELEVKVSKRSKAASSKQQQSHLSPVKRRKVGQPAVVPRKEFVVDRVSYNSAMGMAHNRPVAQIMPPSVISGSGSNNNKKKVSGRDQILKKLNMSKR